MLPIFRILPVGGVLLAITLLALALNPPASMHAHLTPGVVPMRGAMTEQSAHPEWRQFLLLAAIRRTDELNRLRELPDTAVRAAPARTDEAPAAPAAPKWSSSAPASAPTAAAGCAGSWPWPSRRGKRTRLLRWRRPRAPGPASP